jgi:nucleotide-binding universal stress UspA family protein
MMTLNNVLIPIDFSECSDAALWQARVMAGASPHATLHLFHVVTEPMHETWASYAPGAEFIGLIREMEAASTKRLETLITPLERTRQTAVTATAWGDPVDEILKYARTHDIDLIVCGTHQRHGLSHFVLGSTAERIVQMAPCPVFTVPARPGAKVEDVESAADVPLDVASGAWRI